MSLSGVASTAEFRLGGVASTMESPSKDKTETKSKKKFKKVVALGHLYRD